MKHPTLPRLVVSVSLVVSACVAPSGPTHTTSVPIRRVPIERAALVGFAWLGNGSMVVAHYRGLTETDDFWLVSPGSGSVEVLEVPDRPDCRGFNVTAPTALPDGRLGFLERCTRTGTVSTEFRLVAMEIETSDTDSLVGDEFPFSSRSFTWDPDVRRGLAADGDDICGSIAWLTPQGVELPSITIEDGGRSWGLDEYFHYTPGTGCPDQGIADWPAWSPDGNEIAFVASPQAMGLNGFARLDAPYNIYVMDPDEQRPRKVLQGVVHPRNLAWSPDTRWLAFSGEVKGTKGAWVLAPETQILKQVTELPLALVAWSPDGSELAGLYNSDIAKWPPETDILIFDVSRLS